MEEESLVSVKIFGQQYTVRGRAHSNYIKDVAEYVDNKMQEIAKNLRNPQSDLRIAILAAMNITDELFSLKRDIEKLSDELDKKGQSLIDLIQDNL